MKDCLRYAPMIGSREGELAPDEARALFGHLAGCPACRARQAALRQTDGLVAEALLARASQLRVNTTAAGKQGCEGALQAAAPDTRGNHK